MSKYNKYIFIVFLFLANIFASSEQVALVLKTKGNVQYQKYSEKVLSTLNIGTALYNDDLLRTGADGLVVFVYIDDKTMIKIQSNSEVYIRGESENESIIKQINIGNGRVKSTVSKQKKGEFTIVTPTSVASVKGTEFWTIVDRDGEDRFYGLSGTVEVKNLSSGQIVGLEENTTAISLPDGTINIRQTNELELPQEDIYEIEGDLDDIENFGKDSTIEVFDNTTESELRIKLQNAFGEEKEIIVRYR
jgi:hypothetical protein